MVLSPEQLDSLAQPHAVAVGALEDLGWGYIIQTLAKYGGQSTDQSPDDWKQELLQHAVDITKYMSKHSAATFALIVNQVSTSIRKAPLEDQHDVLQWLGRINGKVGQSGTVAESRAVNRLVTNAQKETVQYLNLAKRNMNRNATAAFKRIVSDSALAMRNGTPRDKALLIASRRWSMRGVPALIDKAGKSWQPDVYMRLVVTNQVKQTSNLIALQHAKDFGAFVKVSSHAACRPTHLQYQGQIYSVNGDTSEYPDLYSSTSYGSAGGLCGINCHHYVMPYVPSYVTPDVDSLNPDENNERYQLTQKQRSLERSVRAAKREQLATEQFGDDGNKAMARRLVQARQSKLAKLVNQNSSVLVRQISREQIMQGDVHATARAIRVAKQVKAKRQQTKAEAMHRISNDFTMTIDVKKQARHLVKDGVEPTTRSYLLPEVSPQDLVNEFAGSGKIRLDSKGNWFRNFEYLESNSFVGYVHQKDGTMKKTKKFRIAYSKTGTHVFPDDWSDEDARLE